MSDLKKYIEDSKENLQNQINQFSQQAREANANMLKAQGALEVTLQMEEEYNKPAEVETTEVIDIPKKD